MKDRSPFGIAGVWENWRDPASGEWVRTFAIITVPANSLVSRIHDRMPAILAPDEFDRWLGEEVNPRDLMRSCDPEAMVMWPVSTRVNSPKNDDAGFVEAVDLTG
jgi:putative SOS response-associated peptidase YedK